MGRHSPEKISRQSPYDYGGSSRHQHQSSSASHNYSTRPKRDAQPPPSPPEQQQQQQTQPSTHRRSSLREKFGANTTQLRLTLFIVLGVALVLTGIAFFSTNWLEVEQRYYGSKFKKLGLWRMCFNSFSAPDDFQFRKFYVGCRWIFADEYKPIRKFLLPGSLTLPSNLITLFSLLHP